MLRVRNTFTGITGTPYVATHHFVGDSPTDVAAAVAAVGDFWDDLKGLIATDVQWAIDDEVLELNSAGQVTNSFTIAGPTGAGTSTSALLPVASQLLVQWRTGLYQAGREIRGRTFVPGVVVGNNVDGKVGTTTRGIVDAACIAYVGTAATPAVWSKKNSTVTPISAGFCWEQFAMLTSRRD